MTTVRETEGFPALLADVRARVDATLAMWLEGRVARAQAIGGPVGSTAAAASDLTLRGGKRLRAALVAAAFAGLEPDWALSMPGMLAVELLQTYLLIHDDWMDGDEMRRGGPAVHVVLREKLGSFGGDAGAVLAGDLVSGWAQEALLESTLPAERVLRAARFFARTQVDVVSGQIAEMTRAANVETVYALKTASYTVTGPLLLGATLAGADDAYCAELERFGRPLGIAFQLRDDLLGAFGDASRTGKPVGSDFREGKETALIAELRRDGRADSVLARLRELPTEEILHVIEASGARERVEARLAELCDEARTALAGLGMSERGRAWLNGAVNALGDRSS